MTDTPAPLASEHVALRAHDVHQGLHDVDRNVGLVGSELETTQLVGMAAALATTVKPGSGRDVVRSAASHATPRSCRECVTEPPALRHGAANPVVPASWRGPSG